MNSSLLTSVPFRSSWRKIASWNVA